MSTGIFTGGCFYILFYLSEKYFMVIIKVMTKTTRAQVSAQQDEISLDVRGQSS